MERERMTEQELQENRAFREEMIEAKMQLMADKRALEAYPIDSYEGHDDMYRQRGAFAKGYEQAEKDVMDKAKQWFREHANISYKVETNENGEPLADSYIDYCKKRLEAGNEMFEAFKAFVES